MRHYDVFGLCCADTCHYPEELHSEKCKEIHLAHFKGKKDAVIDHVRFMSRFGWPDKGIFSLVQVYEGKDIGKLVYQLTITD